MSDRTTARVVGALFIVGTLAGISAGLVLQPLFDAADPLVEIAGSGGRVATGALLQLVMGAAVVAIPVVIAPVLRRSTPRLAEGYVLARGIEGAMYLVGVLGLLTVLTSARELVAGSDAGTLGAVVTGAMDWSNYTLLAVPFSISAVVLNVALYSSRLVPRWLAGWGALAAVPFLVGPLLVMYGLGTDSGALVALQAPLGVQEMVFAIWLLVVGFRAPAPLAAPERELVGA